MMSWELCSPYFEDDGQMREIYVFETTAHDWDELFDALETWGYQTRFSVDAESATIPSSARSLFERRLNARALLEVSVGKVNVRCHFFCEGEFELDFDPTEVVGADSLEELVRFIERIGRLLDRRVCLTRESDPDTSLLEYRPDVDDTRRIADFESAA